MTWSSFTARHSSVRRIIGVTLALACLLAAACGAVNSHTDAAPADAGATPDGPAACVLGASRVGQCNLGR